MQFVYRAFGSSSLKAGVVFFKKKLSGLAPWRENIKQMLPFVRIIKMTFIHPKTSELITYLLFQYYSNDKSALNFVFLAADIFVNCNPIK